MAGDVRVASFGNLDGPTLYGILQLRAAVFVVDQECAYLDPDGRDIEPTARHLWIEDGGRVVATLRLLDEPGAGHRIGRVATAGTHRRQGLAQRLTAKALELVDGWVILDAQSGVVGFYERFGFNVVGEEFVEDGIRHLPMRRP